MVCDVVNALKALVRCYCWLASLYPGACESIDLIAAYSNSFADWNSWYSKTFHFIQMAIEQYWACVRICFLLGVWLMYFVLVSSLQRWCCPVWTRIRCEVNCQVCNLLQLSFRVIHALTKAYVLESQGVLWRFDWFSCLCCLPRSCGYVSWNVESFWCLWCDD